MKPFLTKLRTFCPIWRHGGSSTSFALAEREDIERWDVVLCSAWSDEDWTGAVRWVAELLKSHLEPREMTLISRIAVLRSNNPRTQELPESLDGVVPGDGKVVSVSLPGSEVRRAFIFKAQHPPAVLEVGALTEAPTFA